VDFPIQNDAKKEDILWALFFNFALEKPIFKVQCS
jgi:hypothetical protein